MRATSKQLVLAVTALFVSGLGQASGESITYQLVNYPVFQVQGGFTLSGSFTTDGTLGPIDSSHILSWSWFAASTAPFGFSGGASSSDLGAMLASSGLVATPTELYLPPGGVPGGPPFLNWGTGFPQPALTAIFDVGGTPPQTTGYIDHIHGGADWIVASPSLADPQGNFVIASLTGLPGAVPEPSSMILVGTGALCAMAYSLARKLRAPRNAGSLTRASPGRVV
jgi:hypothetical protein